MATSNGQRVAAFLLAGVFLVTTIGATAYVVWQINDSGGVIVPETAEQRAIAEQQDAVREQAEAAGQTCGISTVPTTDPRPIPTNVTQEGPVAELITEDIRVGEGEDVQPGDCVTALYYGTLATDGTRFDGNYAEGQPIEFSLDGVIDGWTEGIPGMKVGGVRRLAIPAAKAYGEAQQGGIPPNSDLIFEVEILATRRGS